MRSLSRIAKVVGVLAGLAVGSGVMEAKDIYIAQNATGSNNGTSCANAYVYGFFNNSANWGSGAAQIGPGTTVHLCGTFNGTAGQQLLYAQGSGVSGSPITIIFESGASLSAPYWSSAGAIILSNRSYFIVDGGAGGTIANTANGTGLANHQTSTAIQALHCANCEFKNLTIQNLYVHTQCEASSGCDTAVDATQVNAIQFSGTGVLIHDNVIHDVGWALAQNYTNDSNIQIYNNQIYHMDHGLACAGADYVVSSEFVYNNHFHDMAAWDTGNSDQYHHDGIHCFNGSGGKIQNLYIYNNLFDGNEGNCCVTSWVFLEGSSGGTPWTDATGTAYVWNNVFIGSLDLPDGQLNVERGTGHLLYNNTIIGPNAGGQGVCIALVDKLTNITIENNALEGCNQLISGSGAATFSAIDFNDYANSSGGNPNWQFALMSASTLPTWRTPCQCDSHSKASLSVPLALSPQGLPLAGYLGIGIGINLTGLAVGDLASLASDSTAGGTHSPVSRSKVLPWDIGAFAYSGLSVAPPTNLTLIVQ